MKEETISQLRLHEKWQRLIENKFHWRCFRTVMCDLPSRAKKFSGSKFNQNKGMARQV